MKSDSKPDSRLDLLEKLGDCLDDLDSLEEKIAAAHVDEAIKALRKSLAKLGIGTVLR